MGRRRRRRGRVRGGGGWEDHAVVMVRTGQQRRRRRPVHAAQLERVQAEQLALDAQRDATVVGDAVDHVEKVAETLHEAVHRKANALQIVDVLAEPRQFPALHGVLRESLAQHRGLAFKQPDEPLHVAGQHAYTRRLFVTYAGVQQADDAQRQHGVRSQVHHVTASRVGTGPARGQEEVIVHQRLRPLGEAQVAGHAGTDTGDVVHRQVADGR
uniref:UL27A n=1 Tax=Panine betaherpesvirus 2 TaxID=188763 RepID=A0A8F7K8P1_9BETA|nr:UL27A [Panine betaherpesvirus 2]